MNKEYRYIAVTDRYDWCCANCGTDVLPTMSSTHKAIVSRSGEARTAGPVVFNKHTHNNKEIVSISDEAEESHITCEECGEDYVPAPVDDSLASLIRDEEVEELIISLPVDNFHIHYFVPGEDAKLYGDKDVDGFVPKSPFVMMKGGKNTLTPCMKKDKLIWKYQEGITLDNHRFSDELKNDISRPLRVASGAEDFPDYGGPEHEIRQNLVVWVREDLIKTEAETIVAAVLRSLLTHYNATNWWKQKNVVPINMVTVGKKGPAFFGGFGEEPQYGADPEVAPPPKFFAEDAAQAMADENEPQEHEGQFG